MKYFGNFIPEGETGLHDYDIVVFSHLRWGFVYQRPQHLLSRLALNSQVFFIEEPTYDPGVEPYLECSNPALNVLVFRLRDRALLGDWVAMKELPATIAGL